MKFKIGDRVRISINHARLEGELAKVFFVYEKNYYSGNVILLELENPVGDNIGVYRKKITAISGGKSGNYYWNISKNEIKHARIKNTRIARKLNPKYKEEGEWLIIAE